MLVAPAWAIEPTLAFEWRPLHRGDLTWVQQERGTGLVVGGDDGFARPAVQLDVGAWLTDRFGLQASLGVARLQTTTWLGDVYAQRHWGVLRPGVDAKLRVARPPANLPQPWLLLGAHVDIPSARDVSNGYTRSDQEAADEVATAERMRLGALGGRAALGVEQRLLGGLSVGAMYGAQWQRSLFVREDPRAITSLLTGEGALLLIFDWPRAAADPPDDT